MYVYMQLHKEQMKEASKLCSRIACHSLEASAKSAIAILSK